LTQIGFRTLTQAQGLPNAIATSVAQDGDGFLWVGTLGGLARWDGYHFRVFRADPGRPGELPDNVIQTLHTDPGGRLWVGTSAAGLARWDADAERFVRTPAGPGGLSHVSVRAIADDGSGGLWVGTEGGLDHLDPATGAVRSARAGDAGTPGLPALPVYALLRDHRGTLWVGTAEGLYRGRGGRFEAVPGPASVQSLAEDAEHRVWVGTERQGAFVIGPEGGAPQPVRAPARDGELADQPVVAMLEVRPGETWLGTLGWGIVAVDAAHGRTRSIRNLPALPASLADNAVRALFRDRSGLVWVATNRGLSRYDPGQSAVLTMFGTPVAAHAGGAGSPDVGTDVASMGNTQISWILPTADGRIWLGTHKGGVDIIDPEGARVGALAPDPAHPLTALPADMVLSLAQAGDGSVYIGTKRGLYRASADGRQVRRVAIAGRDPAASTWALLVDGPRLWIGGQFDGLWQLDLASGRSRPMLREPGQALTDLRTTVLLRDPAGWLWIGTRNGLNRYDPATGVLQRIRRDAGRPDGLDAGFVATLYVDHHQRLWVGTYGGGIAILEGGVDAGRPHFVHLRTHQGLPDENVNSLIEDAAGEVWACTDGGLASIDPQTLAVRTLRRADGLLFPTYWTGSAARTPEGELLFGGDGGMTIVQPRLRRPWNWHPPLVVTRLRIGGRPVPVGPYAA
ncbi:MAG: histidine kinase, partial [Burkholderiales bacterium]|nr:histidine kinase [Burkholderiales bacterium]